MIETVTAFEPTRGRNCVTVTKNSMFSVKNLQKAETVPKKTKKTILTDSQGPRHPRAQDLVKIGFFGFFGQFQLFEGF